MFHQLLFILFSFVSSQESFPRYYYFLPSLNLPFTLSLLCLLSSVMNVVLSLFLFFTVFFFPSNYCPVLLHSLKHLLFFAILSSSESAHVLLSSIVTKQGTLTAKLILITHQTKG